jgi:hypothetical protein
MALHFPAAPSESVLTPAIRNLHGSGKDNCKETFKVFYVTTLSIAKII